MAVDRAETQLSKIEARSQFQRLAGLLPRCLVLCLEHKWQGDVIRDLGGEGVQVTRAPHLGKRLIESPLEHQKVAILKMSFGRAGIERNRAAQLALASGPIEIVPKIDSPE